MWLLRPPSVLRLGYKQDDVGSRVPNCVLLRRRSCLGWPASIDVCCTEQRGQSFPRMEHARFHSVFRDADDFGDLADCHLVVVDEINDLSMFRRKSRKALSQDIASLLLLDRDLRVVAGVLERGRRHLVQLIRVSPPK
jgi:hypothetical protein